MIRIDLYHNRFKNDCEIMSAKIRVKPLTPAIGAEFSGINLARLTTPQHQQLRDAWLKHKVVVVRDQDLSLDQLCELGNRFGELMQLPYIEPVAGHPHVIRVLKEAHEVNMGVFGGEWHSDFSFLIEPPSASILYASELPSLGGDTLWVNLAAAYNALPASLATLLNKRQVIHTGTPYGVQHAPDVAEQFTGSIKIERSNPEADQPVHHPAIRRHVDTGENSLFINPTYTVAIDGLEAAESEAQLAAIFRHCTRPEFSCRFRWQPGSVAIWDNRNTMHYAVNDYDGQRRCLYRVTVKGEAPQQG
jgi:taurine dioxygenase